MDGGAIVLGETRGDKTLQVEDTIDRYSSTSSLTSATPSLNGQMSGFAVSVDPSGSSSAVTATLCGATRII